MKIHVLLSAIVLIYLVVEGSCGTVASSSDSDSEDKTALKAKQGIFDKLVSTLIDGYETATKILYDLLEKEGDKGILTSMYEKLKEELSKLKDFILGGKPTIGEEVDAAKRTVEKLIDEYKHVHANSKMIIEGALESLKNAKLAKKIVNEGPDVIRHRIYEIDSALKDHVFDGVTSRIDSAKNDVNYAEGTSKSSVDFLEEQGVKFTDMEKEVLDGITKRVRDSLIHTKEKKE